MNLPMKDGRNRDSLMMALSANKERSSHGGSFVAGNQMRNNAHMSDNGSVMF